MERIMISPSRYVQGCGAMKDIGRHISILGKRILCIGGKRGLQSVEAELMQSCSEHHIACSLETFRGGMFEG